MSNMTIRAIYEARLKTWAAGKNLPVAWENTQFTPPTSGQYLKADLLKSPTFSLDLEGEHRGYEGLFQISIFSPNGTGSGSAEALAVELDALFRLNLRLTKDGFAVQINSPCSEGPPIPGNTHFMIPVSFGYRADTV